MRILVGWENTEEADLLKLYLGVGDNEVEVVQDPAKLVELANRGDWSVALLAMALRPTVEEAFVVFREVQEALPGVPIVLGIRSNEMLGLPRFLNHGLRYYIVRDNSGDFVFLTISTLESAVDAARAEEAKKLAGRLREEMDGVRKLQESIIPHGLKTPPGYKLAARYERASQHRST